MVTFTKLQIKDIEQNNGQIEGLPKNPRLWGKEELEVLKTSLVDTPELFEARGILCVPHKGRYVAIGGNMRLAASKELKMQDVPCIVYPEDTPVEKLKEIAIKDNGAFGEWDYTQLAEEWDDLPLGEWGVPEWNADEENTGSDISGKYSDGVSGSLSDRFVVPPFSVLDTRRGYWIERKRKWKELINDKGESREGKLSGSGLVASFNNGVSILDPVLSEVICTWFGIKGGSVFDTFAGDTVFGYVAATLGMQFRGIELREEQAAINNQRTRDIGMSAEYINDDGQNVLHHFAPESQDLFFSCPPYYDLEVYSDKPNDASNQDTYEDFLQILDNAFTGAIKCLKQNRFAVIVVGDVRGKDGFYYNFPDDIKRIFAREGMRLYNDIVMIESVGTLGLRVTNSMRNRKVGKCHQNVMVFYKGGASAIQDIYPDLKYTEEEIYKFYEEGKDAGEDLES